MTTIVRAVVPEDIEAVRELMREFTTQAISLDPEAAKNAPTFDGLEAELAALPGSFGPPHGCLLLACDAGRPAGCVAYRSQGDGTVELKRMYVRPDLRGKGVGAALVEALLADARASAARRMVLDSYHTMTDLVPAIRAVASWDFPPLNERRRRIR